MMDRIPGSCPGNCIRNCPQSSDCARGFAGGRLELAADQGNEQDIRAQVEELSKSLDAIEQELKKLSGLNALTNSGI